LQGREEVSAMGSTLFRTHGSQGFGFGLHSTGLGLHGLEQLSLIICESCTTTSSAIANAVKAVKLSKKNLLINHSVKFMEKI
jgi:hypothetical protein